MKKFKGFTLSELNIALIVVGILCALLIPAIVNTMPSPNRIMIKRAYYNVSNIVYNLLNDTSLYEPHNDIIGKAYNGFDDIKEVKYKGTAYSGDTKFSGLFITQLNTEGSISTSSGNCSFESGISDCKTVTTTDGMKWSLGNKTLTANADGTIDASEVVCYILVDVNGNKGPSCYQGSTACSGLTEEFDQFRLKVYIDGMIEINSGDSWAKEIIKANSTLTSN